MGSLKRLLIRVSLFYWRSEPSIGPTELCYDNLFKHGKYFLISCHKRSHNSTHVLEVIKRFPYEQVIKDKYDSRMPRN